MSSGGGTIALREALRAHGGTVARSLAPEHQTDQTDQTDQRDCRRNPGAPQLAAGGPRAAGHEPEYELLMEMILEGSLLHYGAPRVLSSEDRDLALLLGDQLYALGLSRLAELGDLDAVGELADLISLLAQAQAQARAGSDPGLADAVWEAGAVAIGWGRTPGHEAAKALARSGDERAVEALRKSARREGG
jgi:hypothetical protein